MIGVDDVLKITDWGTATILGTVGHRSQVGGTYAYMGPEYFMLPPKVGRSADIWASGVVLYEMLTKKLPFNVTDPKMRNNPFAWKPVIDAGIFNSLVEHVKSSQAGAIQELIEKCLTTDDKRLQRPSEVLEFMRAKNLYLLTEQEGFISQSPSIPVLTSQGTSTQEPHMSMISLRQKIRKMTSIPSPICANANDTEPLSKFIFAFIGTPIR
jgi:serine/threonine protein kinase